MSTPRPAPRADAAAPAFDAATWNTLDFTDRVRVGTNLYVLQGLGYPFPVYLFHAVKLGPPHFFHVAKRLSTRSKRRSTSLKRASM